MKYTVAAQRAWVVNKNQELLIVQYIEARDKLYQRTCGLPGGKVEVGESLDDSLIKEVLEETGIRVIPGNVVGLTQFTTPFEEQKQIMAVIRLAKVVGGKLRGDRQENYSKIRPAWVPLDQVAKLKLAFDEAGEIIRLIQAHQLMQ